MHTSTNSTPYGADFWEHGGGNALESAMYNPEIFNMVLQYGGDVNQRNGALLRKAAQFDRLEQVKMLIDAGVDANAKDDNGWTALLRAAQDNSSCATPEAPDVVNLLLDSGADINIQDERGLRAIDRLAHRDIDNAALIERLTPKNS